MSNNLGLDQVAENQAAKEVTINTATGQLDAALTETFVADYTAGSDITLTNTQYRRAVRMQASNLTASGKKLTLPALKKLAVITSDASNTQSLSIVRGSTTLALAPGYTLIVYTDGTTNGLLSLGGSVPTVAKPYDVGTYCNGKPDAGELLLRFNFVRAVTLPASLSGSRITAATAATAQTDFLLTKNGSTIATIRFAAAGTVASIVGMASDVAFAVNDQMAIVAPGSQDATLADIAFTIAGVQ